MNKTAYVLGIIFLCIALAAGLLNSTLLVLQGFSFAYLQSFAHWFISLSLVYLISHFFVLRYFYVKQWKFVFAAACASVAIFVVNFSLQYFMLLQVARELAPLQQMVSLVSLLATLVFSVTLMTQARHDRILLSLAITMMVVTLVMIGALAAVMQGSTGEVVVNVIIWAGAAGNLFPLFFVAVFWREIKQVQARPSSGRVEAGYNALGGLAMISTFALLFLGIQVATESYWQLHWQRHGPEAVRKVAERFEARIFSNANGDTLRYLLLKPLDYDSTQRYPLVTCLHGGPTRVATNIELTQPATLLSEHENRKKYPAFVFVPQARPGVLWGGVPVPSMGTVVLEAMDALEKEFSIDKDRSYITGTSGGGYGTWHYICTYPERFAAAMPMCGGGDPALAHKITHVPVWAFHGDVDRNVPVTGTRNMIEAIRKAGGNPKYNEYEGVGHYVWPSVEKTEGVLEWMFAQRRKAANAIEDSR